MATIPGLMDMLQAGMHFGHQKNRWHPKMAQYIFGVRSNVHVINLEKTQKLLGEAADFVQSIAANGGEVLFVGTKRQATVATKAAAESCGMPYITERWLGGFLTNFDEINKLLTKFRKMKEQRDSGELEKYTKKERVMFDKEIAKLEGYLSGVEQLKKRPAAIIITDLRIEKTARKEARVTGTPIISICDTNVNPDAADLVIPANDDAVKSIALVTSVLAEAINAGKAQAKANAPAAPAAKPKTSGKKNAPLRVESPV